MYGAEKEAQTLEVVLEDGRTGIQVTLLYGVLPKYDVITRSAQIINTKENIIYLEKAASACLDFVTGKYDVISFTDVMRWSGSYQMNSGISWKLCDRKQKRDLQSSIQSISDSDRRGNNRRCRACYAMSFVYSGGFQAEVEKTSSGRTEC